MTKSFKIIDGKVKTDIILLASELNFALEEGWNDETILTIGQNISTEINRLKKILKDVV